MKFNKILIFALFLFAIVTISAVNAFEDTNGSDSAEISDTNHEDNLTDDGEYTTVVINIPSTVDDEEDTIDIGLPENISGNLSVKVNGTPVKIKLGNTDEDCDVIYINTGDYFLYLTDEDTDEFYIKLYDGLESGFYNVEVNFKTQTLTYSNSGQITLNKTPQKPVDIELEDTYVYGHSNQINITAPEYLIDTLDIKINGIPFTSSKKSQTLRCVDISKLGLGRYLITVSYNNTSTTEEFDVVNQIVWPEVMKCMESDYVTLILHESANGTLKVKLDNVLIGDVKLQKGVANVLLSNLSIGYHYIVAEYTGGDFEIDSVVDIIEVNPKITYPYNMAVGDDEYLCVNVGNSSGTLYVDVDNMAYTTLNITGQTKLSLKDFNDGIITVSLRFMGSDGILYMDEDYDINIEPVEPIFDGLKNISAVYASGKTYKFKVYGSNGKLAGENEEFIINIADESIVAYTNKNGIVKFKIPNALKPGKYILNAGFNDYEINYTLVVKHIVKLKSVKVKKSAKKLVLKASLKIKLKGKKIIFKFNGKIYVGKTNKKGIAKVVIKKSVLVKLKKGKKIVYQATYKKDSVKKSVKVL